MSNPFVALDTADFAEAAQNLLPQGLAWPRDTGSTLYLYLRSLAEILAALHARAGVLSETESFPPTAIELLPDWELAFGLPDPCVGQLPTLQQRQAAVKARLAATGGQSVPYFIGIAAALGFTITVSEHAQFRCGQSGCGAPLDDPFLWTVRAPAETVVSFSCGLSGCGEPLEAWGNAALTCPISRYAPAHTTVKFEFG